MSKNDENQPLLDKDDSKTDYTAEGEAAGGKEILFIYFFKFAVYIFSLPNRFSSFAKTTTTTTAHIIHVWCCTQILDFHIHVHSGNFLWFSIVVIHSILLG